MPDPEKDHNQFDGWYLSKDFAPEKKVESLGKTCFLGDVTLYAKWTEWNTVSAVTFSKIGEVDHNDEITLSCATEGAAIHYTVGNEAEKTSTSSVNIKITNDVTVKAYATKAGMNSSKETSADYTIKTYTVTFNTKHGAAPAVRNLKKGEEITRPDNLTENGYTFGGWYTDSSFGSNFDFTSTKVGTTKVDIYARWTLNPVTTPSFEVLPDGINIKWTNPAASDLSRIIITSTDGTIIEEITDSSLLTASKKASFKLTGLDSSKSTYTFKIKAKSSVFESTEKTVTVNMPGTVAFSEINEKGPTNSKDTVTFDVVVTGKNFNAAGFSNNSFSSDSVGGVVPTVTVDSDIQITLGVTVPKTAGTYNVNLKYAGMTQTKQFTVREYAVGDIVYSDGSISKTALTTTATPVAVIFRAKTTSADGNTLPALGVGLKQSESKVMWAKNGTTGYTTMFTNIICTPSVSEKAGAATTATFTGDKDGSDNWSAICRVDTVDTKDAATNYPAFDWVNNYGTTYSLPAGYQDGWYMPSIYELTEYIYKNREVINKALTALGDTVATPLIITDSDTYWSSSQSSFYDNTSWELYFGDAYLGSDSKDLSNWVRSVRAF